MSVIHTACLIYFAQHPTISTLHHVYFHQHHATIVSIYLTGLFQPTYFYIPCFAFLCIKDVVGSWKSFYLFLRYSFAFMAPLLLIQRLNVLIRQLQVESPPLE